MVELQQLLQSSNVSLDIIFLYISILEKEKDNLLLYFLNIQNPTDIASFMENYKVHPRWWNFAVTASLALRFGCDDGIKLVERYEEKLGVSLLDQISEKLPVIFQANKLVIKTSKNLKEITPLYKFRCSIAKLFGVDIMEILPLSTESENQLTLLYPASHETHVHSVAMTLGTEYESLGIRSICSNRYMIKQYSERDCWDIN